MYRVSIHWPRSCCASQENRDYWRASVPALTGTRTAPTVVDVVVDARSSGWWPVAVALALGTLAGVGGYTFRYAEGLSYFKTDPKACVNCHIMQPEYDAWQKSSHHGVAVCVDCHLPHDFVAKYLVKAENGWRHGKMFTTQNFEEPITVKQHGLEVLQDNCLRCHGPLTDGLLRREDLDALRSSHPEPGGLACIHCHFTAGHGVRAGLGGPQKRSP